MVLDKHRKEADFTLAPVAKRLINVNPNTISWLGLIVAAISGIVLYLSWDTHWRPPWSFCPDISMRSTGR